MERRHYIEKQTLDGCLEGNPRYQKKVFKMFYGYAMSICLRYSSNIEDANEILNDSFLKVFSKINQYNSEKKFTNWISKIIVNTAVDRYRKEIRKNIMIEDEFPEWIEDQSIDIIGNLTIEDILKLLRSLPKLQQLVFTFYVIDGYKHDEISQMLQIKPSNSRAILTRAKKKLKQLLNSIESINHMQYVK